MTDPNSLESPEYLEYSKIGAGYESAFRRGDRDTVISVLDAQIRHLESLPYSLKMWRHPGHPWVDVGTMLALAYQRRERLNQTNLAGDSWPYRR
jgi:hypothetical protein